MTLDLVIDIVIQTQIILLRLDFICDFVTESPYAKLIVILFKLETCVPNA